MAKQHSAALQTFADKYNLRLSWMDWSEDDDLEAQLAFIQLGGAYSEGFFLFDPRQTLKGIEPKDRARYLKRVDKDSLLRLQLNADFIEEILAPLGF